MFMLSHTAYSIQHTSSYMSLVLMRNPMASRLRMSRQTSEQLRTRQQGPIADTSSPHRIDLPLWWLWWYSLDPGTPLEPSARHGQHGRAMMLRLSCAPMPSPPAVQSATCHLRC
ncbi:hypothetical protein BGZ61DRAFT_455737 [Ilyonectria robusta]|uniref:uncharacterized protein n=1 Tax=Ilyonectria robusta TaxID=1079257 RepID=UPI001E8E9F3D|nr:uncharacterized protein BGZ61DRAFT_455737 [Ilyonectria robusta]KAH8684169.1 hypothetical protein BGZ61DRAFT_455737 [Ilyonectria robusta]